MSDPDNAEDRAQIAERLRAAREYMGLSQADIAQLVGLPRTAITGIESGTRKVEATELKRLSSIYRRSAEYLLTGCEPTYNGPEQFAFLARAVNGLSKGSDKCACKNFVALEIASRIPTAYPDSRECNVDHVVQLIDAREGSTWSA